MEKLRNDTDEEIESALSRWTLPRMPERMRLKLNLPELDRKGVIADSEVDAHLVAPFQNL
ncbi:hypothetical protein ACFLYE_03580 [Chloroflexota bacterium]